MITWLHKPQYSLFCLNRALALKSMQDSIRQRPQQPPNYIILSGLVAYLLQSIFSTPVRVPPFVNKALSELNMGAVSARFGQFFFSELKLTSERVLEELEGNDGPKVRGEAKITKKPSRVYSFQN
jgi:hypothetical protein